MRLNLWLWQTGGVVTFLLLLLLGFNLINLESKELVATKEDQLIFQAEAKKILKFYIRARSSNTYNNEVALYNATGFNPAKVKTFFTEVREGKADLDLLPNTLAQIRALEAHAVDQVCATTCKLAAHCLGGVVPRAGGGGPCWKHVCEWELFKWVLHGVPRDYHAYVILLAQKAFAEMF